jgi:ABC-type multidrug transport system fused ATPase/permease subunit
MTVLLALMYALGINKPCHFNIYFYVMYVFLALQRFLVGMQPYQSACVNNAAASNWLSMRLQLLAAVLLSAVAALAAVVAATTAASAAAGTAAHSALPSTGPLLSWNLSYSSSSGGGSSGNGSSSGSTDGSSWVGGQFRVDLLGLALAYCLPIVNLLNGLLTSSAETEQDMVAVERVQGLLDSLGVEEGQQPPPPPQQQQRRRQRRPAGSNGSSGLQEPLLPQDQAQQQQGGFEGTRDSSLPAAADYQQQQQQEGAIPALELIDVVMRYRPSLPPALRGVTLSVPVGHKLGVCGRTGACMGQILCRTVQ